MLIYCNKCLMPSTKPDLLIDQNGVCNACLSYMARKEVNWEERKKNLIQILEKYKSIDGKNWDCIIPVSGGKDSTYQVIQMLELGMNPLCVTATTCDVTDIGRRNIENIKNLGVDYIEMSPNPVIRAKLNRIGLKQVGDISWPEHVGIFTIPVRVAVQFKIPLIIWGENSQNEYGGPAAAEENNILNQAWLEEFGGLLGLRVSDLVGFEGLTYKELLPYFYPSDKELTEVGVTGLFLGHYISWDGMSNSLIAQAYNFEVPSHPTLGSMVNYENLDNHQVAIHEYFKFLKFGFGRATDHACLHIRRGRLDRAIGLSIVKRLDGQFPWEYLGKSLEETLKPLDISVEEFIKICDKFTNKKIFQRDSDGQLIKDSNGNLTKINYDND
ncbi:N-acetyl sugar amidotransferase [Candidatus Pseudothioglobus singularis]|jgi:N-acetyl sugar amidotransferase|nr:N-acetyl sugar amidotransferase [Candidatus Pseudothioglobus singularis]